MKRQASLGSVVDNDSRCETCLVAVAALTVAAPARGTEPFADRRRTGRLLGRVLFGQLRVDEPAPAGNRLRRHSRRFVTCLRYIRRFRVVI